MISRRILVLTACGSLLAASPSTAQFRPGPTLSDDSPFLGGVPSGDRTEAPVRLTIAQAIFRALERNLGVLLSEQSTAAAQGARWTALSELLPNVSASVSESRRKTNLEAFGFPLGPTFPRVVGPFNVFDARVFLSQAVFDATAARDASAASHRLAATRLTYRSARDLVVLVSANLYLQALASSARASAARAQFDTSQAVHTQAVDLRQGGIVAGLDVTRAEVRMSTDRQRLTAAENDAVKARLQLARMIGMPIGQEIELVDDIPAMPDPAVTLEQMLEQAYASRADYLAALERVRAAEDTRQAALGAWLPSVRINADYGVIGLTAPTALSTFNVTGVVNVPLFEGGRQQGRLADADAELKRARLQAEDMRAEIYYDVRTAFLDLEATRAELQTATRSRELAALQLTQSRDRFAAGVASNIEVTQAQEAVAIADEQFISATYGVNMARAMLAQSTGRAEDAVVKYLGGSKP